MTIASCKHGVGAFQPCRGCDDETDKATIIAERDRLRAEVANRNQRALDGDKAKAAFDNVFDENERLRAELELHKGALIAEQEHVETLEAELAACRSALAKVGPYYIPATNVSDEEAEEVYAAIDAARKGEGE